MVFLFPVPAVVGICKCGGLQGFCGHVNLANNELDEEYLWDSCRLQQGEWRLMYQKIKMLSVHVIAKTEASGESSHTVPKRLLVVLYNNYTRLLITDYCPLSHHLGVASSNASAWPCKVVES